MQEVDKPGKYLGMPMCVGKNKTEAFGLFQIGLRNVYKHGVIRSYPKEASCCC